MTANLIVRICHYVHVRTLRGLAHGSCFDFSTHEREISTEALNVIIEHVVNVVLYQVTK